MTPLFCYFQGVFLPQCGGGNTPLFVAEKGEECRCPMAVREAQWQGHYRRLRTQWKSNGTGAQYE